MKTHRSKLLTSVTPIVAAALAVFASTPASRAAAAPEPELTISIPAEIVLGNVATVIVNAKHEGVNIVGLPITQVKISYPLDPVTNEPLGDSVLLFNATPTPLNTDASGNVSVAFDPEALGIPAMGGYEIEAKSGRTTDFKSSSTPRVEFAITAASCGNPFTLVLTDVSGSGELLVSTKQVTNQETWTLTYTVKACTPIVAGTKVQGGVVGWVTYLGNHVSVGEAVASAKNKNTVITWILPALAAGDEETITVSIQGSSRSLGTQFLSGAWSAVYQTVDELNNVDPETGLPAPIPPHKTDYTPRATVEVVSELTP
jgi:hypothetical protein